MKDFLPVLVLTIFLVVVLFRTLKVAAENERFAVFLLGRFQEFKGPGLVIVLPGPHIMHRLKIGDVGVVSGSGFVTFDNVDIPIDGLERMATGQAVRIDRFDGVRPVVVESSVAASVMCPNCGHQF